jgi:hypothetical protein
MVHLDCIKKLLKQILWSTIQSSFEICINEDGKKNCAWNMDGLAWVSFIR